MAGGEDSGLRTRIGPLDLDVPRSLGYFGGVALAVGAGLIDPPLGLFIAAIPFAKMANRPAAPAPARWLSQLVEGMAKPVGGDSEGTVVLAEPGALPTPLRAATGGRGRPRAGAREDGRTPRSRRAATAPQESS